jgi:hypothetical protein
MKMMGLEFYDNPFINNILMEHIIIFIMTRSFN